MKKRYLMGILLLCIGSLCMNGCTMRKNITQSNVQNTEEGAKSDTAAYDGTDIAVVLQVDEANKQISLQSDTNKGQYELTYTGASDIKDKYGEIMAASQLKPGMLVQVAFKKQEKKLIGLEIYKDSFEYTQVSDLNVERSYKMMKLMGQKFTYTDKLVVLSEGQPTDLMALNDQDVVTIRGYNKKVCSVTIETGHGYIKLSGAEEFVGGWVEVGKIAKPITENMLIVSPEGEFKLTVAKDGVGGSKSISVKRNEETLVDISDMGAEPVKSGSVSFTITPADAVLKVDGKEQDYKELVILDYGKHKVTVSANGYESYTEVLNVDETLMKKTIELKKEEDDSSDTNDTTSSSQTNTTSESQTSTNSSSTTSSSEVENPVTSDTYKIRISSPEGAEVYFDNEYKGTVPVNFAKTTGTHTITLRQSGYINKSYTVYINEEDEDVQFTFSELLKDD